MEEDTLLEYKGNVLTRFKELEESERATLQGLRGTPEGRVLGKVLGDELEDLVFMLGRQPKPKVAPKRGLATR
jgi:hypothetical protein